ncbi:MAG: alpha/beta hydrolase-fold protein [Gemmatales bacterium]
MLFTMLAGLALITLSFASNSTQADAPKTAHTSLAAWLDQRFQSKEEEKAATQKLIAELQQAKLSISDVEKLLLLGRSSYPAATKKGELQARLKLPSDYVDYETEYFLYVPKSYDPKKQTPIIIIGHGGNGAMDANYARRASQGGIRPWVPVAEKFGFILAAPLTERGWMYIGDAIVMSLISKVQREFNIDPNRVYLTGHSMGGHLSWRSGIFMPDRWAAISPMSGGYDYVANGQIYNLWNVPGYATFGKNEPYQINTFNRLMRDWMKERGYEWTIVEKPGGHEIFGDELPKVAQFFLDHPRDMYRKVVYARRDDGLAHVSADGNPKWGREHKWIDGRVIDRSTIHWLKLFPLPAGTSKEKSVQTVRGEVLPGNHIKIDAEHAKKVRVYLHPKMVDFAQPVKVTLNGTVVHEAKVEPSWECMLEQVKRFDDPGRIYYAMLEFEVTSDVKPVEPRK